MLLSSCSMLFLSICALQEGETRDTTNEYGAKKEDEADGCPGGA